MTMLKKIEPAETFMGRLRHGGDLLEEITEFCIKNNIHLGLVEGIGAVQKARLGYYNQKEQEYHFFSLDQSFEITKMAGNISLMDGKPFVHAHITLSDGRGNSSGGHLAPGTIVFACEIIIQSFKGPSFEREHNENTGLPLWNLKD